MARRGNQLRRRNVPWWAKTGDLRFLPRHLLNLLNISRSQGSIGAMKYIPPCTNFFSLVRDTSILVLLEQRPASANSSSAASSFWPSSILLSAMYHVQSGRLNARLLIRVTQQSISRSHCSGPAPCVLMMHMDWASSQTHSLTLVSFCCVVSQPFPCQIPLVSAAHSLTPTPAFSAQTWTCSAGIWIALASAMTDFGNQKASQCILGSPQWSIIEWWI